MYNKLNIMLNMNKLFYQNILSSLEYHQRMYSLSGYVMQVVNQCFADSLYCSSIRFDLIQLYLFHPIQYINDKHIVSV